MPALPVISPADMGLAADPQQFIVRRLARAMVAERNLADSDDAVDVNDVAPHTAGDGHGRQVIAAGVAQGAQTLFEQSPRGGDQLGGRRVTVVGSEYTDYRSDAAQSEPAQMRQRRHSRLVSRLPAATREVDVTVDQPRKYPPSFEVKLLDTQRRVQSRGIIANPYDARARNQQVFDPAGLGRVEVGVVKDPHSGAKK